MNNFLTNYCYKGSFANWTTWCNNPNENWAAGNIADVAVGDTVLVRGIITDLDNTECQCIGTCVSKKNTNVQVKTVSFIYGKKGAKGQTFRPSFSGETLVFTASTDTSAVSLSGIASKTFVEGKGYQTQAQVDARVVAGVPAWARASSKPTYAYTEITGRITKVSELTNDRGYLFLSSGGCVTDQADTCAVLPYAAKTHNHDTAYAAKSHTHSEYGASGHKHTAIQAPYSGSGGKQPPTYANANELRACMSNETVNGNSQYKNWIYINAYSGSDAGGVTAIGLNRQSLAAYIMRANAGASTWAQSAELLHTSNGLLFLCHMKMNWATGPTIAHATAFVGDNPGTITPDAKGFHFTAPTAWGLASNGTNAVFIANLIGTALPVTAYMVNQVIYVLWTGIGTTSARGNVELIVLRHHG